MGKYLCGIDAGGTKLSTALITETGEIIDKCIECDHADKPESLMVDQITYNRLLRHNRLRESDLPGNGIGCAGLGVMGAASLVLEP
jgi:predicted NBD/HSP70 family sugar kinase